MDLSCEFLSCFMELKAGIFFASNRELIFIIIYQQNPSLKFI